MMRKLDINISDLNMNIWQDDADDPTFRTEIFQGILKHLRRSGWSVARDPEVEARYPSIAKDHRAIRKGALIGRVKVRGRAVDIDLWAETWRTVNQNGHRHDFGRRAKLGYLDRLRADLTFRRICAWVGDRATVTVKDRNAEGRGPRAGGLTALQWIAARYAESWHCDKALGRPVPSASNARGRDGLTIDHGATVWFADPSGRIRRGKAYANINNMWWVATSTWDLTNVGASEIWCAPPAELRRKRNERRRRLRLEAELALAIQRLAFGRAALIKRLLFGESEVYGLWSRKRDAFYRANYSGYVTDSLHAGRYTWEEAVREVRRVPHLLSLVLPDGSHLRAEEIPAAPVSDTGHAAPTEARP